MSQPQFDMMLWPEGKRKAFTMSYDDGVRQDRRLIGLLNRKGIKATFNLNPGTYDEGGMVTCPGGGKSFEHKRLTEAETAELYKDQDVAAHGWIHCFMGHKDSARQLTEVLKSRAALEDLLGRTITGYVYAYGECDENIRAAVERSGCTYSRTTKSSHDFSIPQDFLMWNPTCYHMEEELFSLAETFLNEPFPMFGPQLRLFYVWGHSYEFDQFDSWERIEKFLDIMEGHEDVWYAGNTEIERYVSAYRKLVFSANSTYVYNPTCETIWLTAMHSDKVIKVAPGETVKLV